MPHAETRVAITGVTGRMGSALVRTVRDDAREVARDERPMRRRLPDTRASITHKFNIAGHEGYITVGLFEDHTPGELFITMAKEGSTIGGLMDTIGALTSMTLQYGVPFETLVRKFAYQRFEPSGFTGNPALWPLFEHCESDDVVLVQINPIRRPGAPTWRASTCVRPGIRTSAGAPSPRCGISRIGSPTCSAARRARRAWPAGPPRSPRRQPPSAAAARWIS